MDRHVDGYYRNYYLKNKNRIQKRMREYHRTHPVSREILNNRSKNHNRKLRQMVLQHYSNSDTPKCCCCGIKYEPFLTLDHIDGRKKWGHKSHNGTKHVYQWLKSNNFPVGFQIMCFNCNYCKHLLGSCKCQSR